ncbi:MAG: hypothetical protein HQM12_01360 [SAR324 cluster bacterium]|nr:hypothetical protein [SAR324 cluster bacterium]
MMNQNRLRNHHKHQSVKNSHSLYFVIPGVLLWGAMVSLRHQIVVDMNLGYAQAWSFNIYIGWLYDIAIVLGVTVFSYWLQILSRMNVVWFWVPGAIFVWLATFSNVIHFRFFKTRLEWWVVQLHWQDLLAVSDSTASLAMTPPMILSIVLCLAAILSCLLIKRIHKKQKRYPVSWKILLLNIVLIYLIGRFPLWINVARSNMLSDHVIKSWVEEMVGDDRVLERADPEDPASLDSDWLSPAGKMLASFRDYDDADFEESGHQFKEPPVSDTQWPLWRHMDRNPVQMHDLRQQFGFSEDKPVNVIVIFVESMRAFELLHPDIGPRVYPRLRSILWNNSMLFTQAYSSSFTAGQTVRGQFSTLFHASHHQRSCPFSGISQSEHSLHSEVISGSRLSNDLDEYPGPHIS